MHLFWATMIMESFFFSSVLCISIVLKCLWNSRFIHFSFLVFSYLYSFQFLLRHHHYYWYWAILNCRWGGYRRVIFSTGHTFSCLHQFIVTTKVFMVWLVLKALFCAAIRRDSVSFLRFPFLSHIHVFLCEMLLISRLKLHKVIFLPSFVFWLLSFCWSSCHQYCFWWL